MSETEYFRQACKDQVKFTGKVRANKDHEIALLELEIKELKAINTILQGLVPNKPLKKISSIEKRFQEDMIDEMDSQY
tara:strand:+ start:485 stop:718 length:234 start_codon:yes stop_codon:yes gene_type:complete